MDQVAPQMSQQYAPSMRVFASAPLVRRQAWS